MPPANPASLPLYLTLLFALSNERGGIQSALAVGPMAGADALPVRSASTFTVTISDWRKADLVLASLPASFRLSFVSCVRWRLIPPRRELFGIDDWANIGAAMTRERFVESANWKVG